MKAKQLLCLISTLVFLLTGCSGISAEPTSYTGTAFDSVIALKIYDRVDEDVMNHCITMCSDFENKFSRTIETSEIARINSAGGAPVTVSNDTLELIRQGIYYGDLSDGAFDITIGAVSRLWDFKDENPSVPMADAVTEALSHVNYKNIIISGNTVTLKDPKAAIDVGGIAKGYIADKVTQFLEAAGVRSAIVDLGGNIVAIGGKAEALINAEGEPIAFKIGIKDPQSASGGLIGTIPAADKTVVTSGTYERYFVADGKKYHHILNSKSGMPTDTDVLSVTIISEKGHSADCDALSTGCLALGVEKGMSLVQSIEDTEAIFVDTDGQIHLTSEEIGFEKS